MDLKGIKVLIIDDSDSARQESARKIALYVPPENIHCAANAVETMRILQTVPIHLAFVDVEMPDTDGFSISDYIHRTQPKTQVVFLTGHAELGAKSYDYEPLDFLCKPLDALRLQKTFERYIARQGGNRFARDQIALESTAGFVLISPSDVRYIAREGRKTVIYGTNDQYVMRYSLDELEALFTDFDLFRCHQSYLVPLDKVSSVKQADFGKTYLAVLTDGSKIPVSRGRFEALKKHLMARGVQFV